MDVAKRFENLTAATAAFVLAAGRYAITCDLGGASAVALETRSPAGGDAWLAVPSLQMDAGSAAAASFAADGMMTADLPNGEYRVNVTHSEGDGATVAIARM